MWLREQAIALERAVDKQHGEAACVSSKVEPLQSPGAGCTPRWLTALQRRYEQTRQSARLIAREFGVSDRTLRRIAAQRGWTRPEQAPRDLDPADRLLAKATALERGVFGMK